MGIARYIRVGRDRADLGPAHAGELAAQEANRYAQLRPLDQVLAELHHPWSIEAGCIERLTDASSAATCSSTSSRSPQRGTPPSGADLLRNPCGIDLEM